ncbi:hypothetical protein OsJ_36026 [Oryza sativa Japonica Group]|uniref:Uncharacterized protein n=1 Tax=Oryza sativa subsp. japonica TaxID=39947 RepID=B9GD19_ORYSJ|nr:hypothetical protein OsJ_36026 [Oryza sativa Japonica Group]
MPWDESRNTDSCAPQRQSAARPPSNAVHSWPNMRRLSLGCREDSNPSDQAVSAAILPRCRTRSSGSQQPDNSSNLDEILAGEETDEEMFFRGPTRMPPRPTRDEDKPVLTPKGDRQWQANDFGGNIRVPTGILTVIIKHFFPGIVNFKGRDEPAWSWKHYRIAPDDPESAILNRLPSRLHRVEEDFWVEPWWFLKAKNAWRELIRLKWCNPEWQASSHAHRIRREKMTWPSHRQGSANLSRFQKNLKKKRVVSQMEAYTEGRGEYGEDGRFRCNTHATGKLEAYNEAYVQLHGAGSDWRNSPIDPMAVHMAGGGKKHGRFMIGDGHIDSSAIFGDSSLNDPRPRRRLRTNPDNTNQIEDLERQLQEEREAREREREEREREKERERQEWEQEKERECEERAREKEQDRKERELERKERELEKIAFEQKSSFFEVALRAIQLKLNIDLPSASGPPPLPVMLTNPALSVSSALNGNPFCADHGGAAIVSGAI